MAPSKRECSSAQSSLPATMAGQCYGKDNSAQRWSPRERLATGADRLICAGLLYTNASATPPGRWKLSRSCDARRALPLRCPMTATAQRGLSPHASKVTAAAQQLPVSEAVAAPRTLHVNGYRRLVAACTGQQPVRCCIVSHRQVQPPTVDPAI